MKNKINTLLSIMLLSSFWINAQTLSPTAYGDGSLRLQSQRNEQWNSNNLQWDKSDSISYYYNVAGKVSERRTHFFPNNAWNYAYQARYTYTPTGKPLQSVDSNLLSPVNCDRNTYTYNANDQEILLVNERVSANAWVPQLRYQTTYTAFDSVNVRLTEVNFTNTWENYSRQLHTYNPQNRDTLLTNENWNTNTNQWRGIDRYTFVLNANGQTATATHQKYDTVSASYKNYDEQTYTYDASNRLTTSTFKFWNSSTSSWSNSSKYSYAYNANGDLGQVLTEEWDINNLEWDLYSLQTRTYNANNWQTELLFQSRNGSVWANNTRVTYTYNPQGYLTQELGELWNTNTLVWGNYLQYFYWYEGNPLSSIREPEEKTKLFVYPNPTYSPVTFVNADTDLDYSIYDMQGRLLNQGRLQPGTNSIFLNETSGTFILKAGNSATQIIKQ
jgi:hypothetical protein